MGQEAIHQLAEAVIVIVFEEVDHFVDDDVFEAWGGFLISSRLIVMRWAAMLRLPQRVLMRRTPHAATCTPSTGSHLAISAGGIGASLWAEWMGRDDTPQEISATRLGWMAMEMAKVFIQGVTWSRQ